ncbi:hypothetical protein GC170_21315 [bacterium]|nr:hypothetical protein [bacterium]
MPQKLSRQRFGRNRRWFLPDQFGLEERHLLSAANLAGAFSQAEEVVSIRKSNRARLLEIRGTSGADTVEIGRSARGFVTLTIDGVVRSGDLRDRASFDRRLFGLRVDRLTSVRLVGDDPHDTLMLDTVLGSAARPARIQSSVVAITSPLTQLGTLRIEARSITISAAVRADSIMLSAAGLLIVEAGGSLSASRSISLNADRLVQTGNLAAPAISVSAAVLIRSGTITSPGGVVEATFTENYVATRDAAIDVSSATGTGGTIRIDGGESGHLFNSGTLRATGGTKGGEIRVSGRDVVWVGGGADVSGGTSGGLIHVGGGWQGSDATMSKARSLQVSPHTAFSADRGTLVLWSEESTTNLAAITAPGGSVEVSSKGVLNHAGRVDVGESGRFLLDPKNIVIADNVMGGVPMFELVNPTPNANDNFGASIVPLSTGNVVVTDPGDDAVATNAGAVYLYEGATGVLISTLTGSRANDGVGGGGVTALTNGNFVVRSTNCDNGTVDNAGAVTWSSGTTGVSGVVSASNSLVGSTASDVVGEGGVRTLTNGNYVVTSRFWDNGAIVDAGAVSWGNGATGVSGVVSASNSLVGSTESDLVGNGGVTALTNGNYVVGSRLWDNGAIVDAGAVSWANGTTGLTGVVSASNSLVGSTASDEVGIAVTALTNGNYVVASRFWNNGVITDAGAVTWGNGTSGMTGVVSASNSLVGTSSLDLVGIGGVKALSNGNYVVNSSLWDNGAIVDAGAATWGNGTTGMTGVVSVSNSLVGSTTSDQVGSGGITALTNGNYVVGILYWDNGAIVDAGAVAWGNGTTGTTGVVSASNSLVGSTTSDQVSFGGITALTNGNYVVASRYWDNGAATDAGAVTWGDGTTGVTGGVSDSNSLVGTSANDQVGNGGATALSNGNYVVRSSIWDNGAVVNAGAATWGDGTIGVTGVVSTSNSLVGTTASDQVGSNGVTALTNGNYVVRSMDWDNGPTLFPGAVTWGSGTDGALLTGLIGGAVSTLNSIVGTTANIPVEDSVNGTYLIRSSSNGGAVYVGLQTPLPGGVTFASNDAATSNMSPGFVATPLSAGSSTTLQASNDISLANALAVDNPSGNGGDLVLQAGRSVNLNADITTDDGNLTVLANASASDGVVDAQRDAGTGGVSIGPGALINAGNGSVALTSGTATGLTNRTSGGVVVDGTITAATVAIVTSDSGSGSPDVVVNGTLNLAGNLSIQSEGSVSFGPSSSVTGVTGGSIVTSNDPVSFESHFVQPPSFPFATGTGSISFADDWAVGPQVATLNTSVAASVAGNLSIDGGIVLAMSAGVSVSSTGSLTGNGTFLGPVSVAGGLEPGNGGSGAGNGLLNLATGALTLAGTTTVTMNGTSKTAFDKVAAIGVNLAGATLSLDLSSATLNVGDSITLVDNVSASATSGTFADMAQGALFTANGHTMQISYSGGDGNDVVVTKVGDITADFSIARSGFFYVIASDTYRQTITLTNVTPTDKKPWTFKFVGLPAGVSVVGGTHDGSDWYLNLGDASVPAGGSLGTPVEFVVPSGNAFTYTLEVIGG